MNNLLLFLTILFLFSCPLFSYSEENIKDLIPDEFGMYIKQDFFKWEEYGKDKLLEEKGLIYGIGIHGAGALGRDFSWKPDLYRVTISGQLEVFYNSIEYKGQTWSGKPVTTDTVYKGFQGKGQMFWKFQVFSKCLFGPTFGIAYKNWDRDSDCSRQYIAEHQDGLSRQRIQPDTQYI